MREIVRAVMQEMLEGEMTDALGPRRASARPLGSAPLRLLHPYARHPGRQARAARAAGSGRTVLDRTLRTPPALRAVARGDAGRDVSAGRLAVLFLPVIISGEHGFLIICCHHAAPTGRRARRSEMNRRMRAARLKFAVVLWQLWPMPIKYSGPLMHLKAYAIDGARLRTGKVLAGKYWVEDRTPISALNC